jgi:predicted ATPase
MTILKGWALAEQGQREEGIAQLRHGLAAYHDTGAKLWRSHQLTMLAETYGKHGQAAEGLKVLTEALAVVDRNEERYYEAEIYRLRGELMLQQCEVQGPQFTVATPQSLTPNPQTEAEAELYFLKAIEIARKQQAKSLELRAAVSLARLWQQQSKQHEAHSLLAEIYNWFTEGFDTKDLQEAKMLLEELT